MAGRFSLWGYEKNASTAESGVPRVAGVSVIGPTWVMNRVTRTSLAAAESSDAGFSPGARHP